MTTKSKTISAFYLILFAFLIAPFAAFAQDLARIDGTVTDQNGGVVSGATVKVEAPALGFSRTATTTADGTYSIPQLRPGVYVLTISLNGFSTAKIEALELGVGQTRTQDVSLAPGEVSAVIDISSTESPATIDQSSNRLGVNLTPREVQELPVNGRTYSQLYLTAPGATNVGNGNANEIRFNGRSNEQNQVKYDGIEATAVFDASPGYLTVQGSQFRLQNSLETIQEFRVDSSNYPAEYGTGTGGQINVVSKTGSNDYRGSLFYYVRNDAFDARNFFDGDKPSRLQLNQFGVNFGGKIIKDRLFFFANYEGLRQRSGVNFIELAPSNFARDFVNFFGTADPRGEAARAALGISAVDATAAQSRIELLRATGVINAFPIGTGSPVTLGGLPNAAQFVQNNSVLQLDEDVFNVRVDGKIKEGFDFFARFNAPRGDLDAPDGTTGRRLLASQRPRNFAASVTQVYGQNIFNETKFGINYSPTRLETSVPNVTTTLPLSAISVRLGGGFVNPGVNGAASTGLADPGGLTRQSSAGNGRAQPINGLSYSLIDNLSVVKGNHTMKFGVEFRYNQVRFDQLGGTTLSFASIRDFLLNQNVTAAFIGDLSAPGNFSIATNPVTTFTRPLSGQLTARNKFFILYGQDEWKIRENLTLSYGLRYEYYTPVREKDNRNVTVDAATGQILPSNTDPYQVKNNFGPRLGLTYAPEFLGGKTVFRAGGGLFYGPGQFEDLIQPIESDVFRTQSVFAGGLTSGTVGAVANVGGILQGYTPRAYDTTGYNVPERVLQYGFSVQHELPGSTVLTVGYVGSQGRNLFLRSVTNRIRQNTNPAGCTITGGATTALPTGCGIVNRIDPVTGRVAAVTTIRDFDLINQSLVGGVPTLTAGSILRPFGEIDYKTSGGRDRYDSLQIQVQRRFTGGLSLGGQYVFSKSFGNTQGSNEAVTAQNPFSFAEDFGRNNFDIRHSGNITALYELPIGAGRLLDFGNSFANSIFDGIKVGGIYNGRSGVPLNILVTRADVVVQCVQAGGCVNGTGGANIAQGTVARLSSGALPTGFAAVINTPGGNASRNTRRPDLVPGVSPFLSGGLNGDKRFFLNPAAFAIPAAGTYGNSPRNEFSGPSFHQFDLTFQKRINVTERANFEFRTEIFNIFNKANFSNPPIVLGENLPTYTVNAAGAATLSSGLQPGQPFSSAQTANFGVINSTVGRTVGLGTNRQIQFALRFNF